MPWILSMMSLAVCAQTASPEELTKAVAAYFQEYRCENYQPVERTALDHLEVNDDRGELHIILNESFCSQIVTPQVLAKIEKDMAHRLPKPFNAYQLLLMDKKGRPIADYVPNFLRDRDKDASRCWNGEHSPLVPWVTRTSKPFAVTKGLAGRHWMVNASHGRYYKEGKWRWQRPNLFCTTEDLLTQGFVYPYLIPMLERAGAYVITARERDPQINCVVVDNDGSDAGSLYEEQAPEGNAWKTAGLTAKGFGMPALPIGDGVNPFNLGSARCTSTATGHSHVASATWQPKIPQAGAYAVYVSYATLPGSVDDACYDVFHKGGRTRFRVNQQMGGGTWVYLGTFDFDEGCNPSGRVVLTNRSDRHGVVTADAVRFGGGMGRIQRAAAGTSGMPAFLEGSRYYAQWCGLPDSLYTIAEDTDNDYRADIRTRSHLLNHWGAGSGFMPRLQGLQVPIEGCLAIHTDAGVRHDGSVYGSLAIGTTVKPDSTDTYPAGISRKASADLAAQLLTEVTQDMSRQWDIAWTRRECWDRNYGETRDPNVPSAILEMLSHQNFKDLTYAHDPIFRQSMARAIYKALLHHVAETHPSVRKVVPQPLAVERFSALLTEDGQHVQLSWSPVADVLDASAWPTGFVVYTRTSGGDFDEGNYLSYHETAVENSPLHRWILPVTKGIRHDFKVAAVNEGGESAPSEVLSVYSATSPLCKVHIVNGFNRLSGPARIERSDSTGFLLQKDLGVPEHYSASFSGCQLEFSPARAGREGPGALGYSDNSLEGNIIGGNRFDYPVVHGMALESLKRYSYDSSSRKAWTSGDVDMQQVKVLDFIMGAERDAPHHMRPFKTFDARTRERITDYLHHGGNLLVSGTYIGSDMKAPADRQFIRDVLKYESGGSWTKQEGRKDSTCTQNCLKAGNHAQPSLMQVKGLNLNIPVYYGLNADCYPIQAPDVLLPAAPSAFTAFAYPDGSSAGIAHTGNGYRVIAMGFPFEAITDSHTRSLSMGALIRFLAGQ